MAHWEYLTMDLANLPVRADEIDLLNEAGEQGRELIAIMSNKIAYLRRPIKAAPVDSLAEDRTSRRIS